MKYVLRYALNGVKNKFKARLVPPDEQTPEGVQEVTLEFDAPNDEAACQHVSNQIFVPEGNDRPIANLKKVVSQSRPKQPRGGKVAAEKPLIDLNGIEDPLASKLFDALTPMIDSGELTENDLKLYINKSAVQPQIVNQKPDGVPVAICPQETPQESLAQTA